MIMTWQQLLLCLAGVALFTIFSGWINTIKEYIESNKTLIDKVESFLGEWGDHMTTLKTIFDERQAAEDASDQIYGFQNEIAELMEEGLEVEACRRCGEDPISSEDPPIIYDDVRGVFRITCRCHERATSMWHRTAEDVIASWNNLQREWDKPDHARDIYEMIASEHSALHPCAYCEEECWGIHFEDTTLNKFRIENGCDNPTPDKPYHKTVEASITAWEEHQGKLRRITEISAEDA